MKDIVARRLCAEDFTVEKVIGRGAFGEVQLVRWDLDGCLCVVCVYIFLLYYHDN